MITTGQVTIGLTPTLIDGTAPNNFRLWIHNTDNSQRLLIGGPDVTVTTGFEIDAHGMMEIKMYPLEEVYAVSEKTGHVITWMKQV